MANALLKEGAGGINQREGMTRETEESREQGEKVQQEDIHLLQGERIAAGKTPTNKRAEESVHHLHLLGQGPQEDIQWARYLTQHFLYCLISSMNWA